MELIVALIALFSGFLICYTVYYVEEVARRKELEKRIDTLIEENEQLRDELPYLRRVA